MLAYTALAALVVVDAALVGLALRTPETTSPVPVATAPAATSSPVAPEPAASATGAATLPAPAYPIPASTLVSLGAEGQAMLANSGVCGGPTATSFWSEDNGREWLAQNVPAPVLGTIDITGKSAATVIGAGQDCGTAQSFTTTSSVQEWSAGVTAEAAWYYLPTATGQVGGTTRTGTSPCERTIALVPASNSEATLLCATGSVLNTTNGGSTWRSGGVLLDARAIAALSPTSLVALQTRPDCPGTGVSLSANNGSTWTPGACLTDFDASGPVGLDTQGTRVLAVAANGRSFLSEDAGATFTSLS